MVLIPKLQDDYRGFVLLKFLKDEVNLQGCVPKVSIKIKFLATSSSAPSSSPLSTFGCFTMAQASVLPQNLYLNCTQQKFNSHTYKHYFIRHKADPKQVKCDVQRFRYLPKDTLFCLLGDNTNRNEEQET